MTMEEAFEILGDEGGCDLDTVEMVFILTEKGADGGFAHEWAEEYQREVCDWDSCDDNDLPF